MAPSFKTDTKIQPFKINVIIIINNLNDTHHMFVVCFFFHLLPTVGATELCTNPFNL